MELLIFLTEKCDGIIKVRTCANGIIGQDWMNKEQVSSPTGALESVIFLAVINAHEEREVTIVDIPNAFIQNNNLKKW